MTNDIELPTEQEKRIDDVLHAHGMGQESAIVAGIIPAVNIFKEILRLGGFPRGEDGERLFDDIRDFVETWEHWETTIHIVGKK